MQNMNMQARIKSARARFFFTDEHSFHLLAFAFVMLSK